MAELAAMLPRHEVNEAAFDPLGSVCVHTLVQSAIVTMHNDPDFWLTAAGLHNVLVELESAVAILQRRCDHLAEREIAY